MKNIQSKIRGFLLWVLLVFLTGLFTLSQSCTYRVLDRDARYWEEQPPQTKRQDRVFLYLSIIIDVASENNVDHVLLLAFVTVESSGNPRAISKDGCLGLTQLKLSTARQYSPNVTREDLLDPEINLKIAGQHMAYLKRILNSKFPRTSWQQKIMLIAAAWNAGLFATLKSEEGIPPYRETEIFCQRVLHYYKKYN